MKGDSIRKNSGEPLQETPDVYFDGDFTILVWICVFNATKHNWSHIIDFGSDDKMHNLKLSIFFGNNINIHGFVNQRMRKSHVASDLIELNKLYHLAFVLNGTNGYIYLNGELKSETNYHMLRPRNITRTKNFIGKTRRNSFNMHDLKIFDGALSFQEILKEYSLQVRIMSQNSSSIL